MIFDELFFVELGLELKRRQQKAQTGIAFRLDDRVREAIKKILPFHPTAAQKACPERNRRRHGKALSHAAFAARGCRLGQDHCRLRSRHHRHRERISGRADGADGNSRAAALFFRAADSRECRIPHRPADRLARKRPQARNPPPHRARQRPTGHRHARAARRKSRIRPTSAWSSSTNNTASA